VGLSLADPANSSIILLRLSEDNFFFLYSTSLQVADKVSFFAFRLFITLTTN